MYIWNLYKTDVYKEKYNSLEDFGKYEFNMDKGTIFMYKNVGEAFFDEKGNCLIENGADWGVGKLNEMRQLNIDILKALIANEFLTPEMTLKEIRDQIQKCKRSLPYC